MPRPRIHASNEERQKAYRERHRNETSVTKPVGRPRIYADDRSRMRAWYMRSLAMQFNWSGYWADQARAVQAKRLTAPHK